MSNNPSWKKETRKGKTISAKYDTTEVKHAVLELSIADDGVTTNITRYFRNNADKQKFIEGLYKLWESLNV